MFDIEALRQKGSKTIPKVAALARLRPIRGLGIQDTQFDRREDGSDSDFDLSILQLNIPSHHNGLKHLQRSGLADHPYVRHSAFFQSFWKSNSSSSIFGIGNQNAFLVNRNSGGGFQFSRDPLNLLNKHSYKVRASGIRRNG